MQQEYFSALVQLLAGFGFAGMILVLSVIFGRRAKLRKAQDIPYECGNVPEGDGAPAFFSIKYYMVAVLFLVFDLEVIFLYPWALNFKQLVVEHAEAFGAMAVFIAVLLAVYAAYVALLVVSAH